MTSLIYCYCMNTHMSLFTVKRAINLPTYSNNLPIMCILFVTDYICVGVMDAKCHQLKS